MKHIAIIILLAVMLPSIRSYAQYNKEISLKVSIEDFGFEYDNNGELVIFSNSKDIVYDEDSKLPGLPFALMNVALPLGSDFMDVKFDAKVEPIKKGVTVSPNPIPVSRVEYTGGEKDNQERATYEIGTYPLENIKFTGKMDVGGYTIFSFKYSPFKYDSEAKVLSLFQDCKVSIAYSVDNKCLRDYEYDDVWLRALESIVINPEDIDNERFTSNPRLNVSSLANTIEDTPIEYIIITKSALAPSFAPLVEWKNTKGVRTIVATTEDIDNAYVGNNLAVKIKKYIHDKYRSDRVKYVLLGGDDTVVPVVRCYGNVNAGNDVDTIPTDIFYGCFDGDFEWNGNGNSIIGEVEDNFSIAPQVFISRLPIRTSTHVSSYLNKLLVYEKNPNSLNNWPNRILMCGNLLHSYLSNSPSKSDAEVYGETIYNNYIAPYYSGTRDIFYDTNTSFAGGAAYDLTKSNLQTQLANGYSFVEMNTHGNQTGWTMESGAYYSVSDANTLTSTTSTIITTQACLTNAFDCISDGNRILMQDPCLSEGFIRNPNSGVVAYYGCSREGWFYGGMPYLGSSAIFESKFYNTLLSFDIPKNYASVVTISKLQMAPDSYSYGSKRWLYFGLNPIGDSEMSIYTNTPQPFANPTFERSGTTLIVNTGVLNCRVCVMSADDMGQTYYKVAKNVQNVVFDNIEADMNITVCITKDNYVPSIYHSTPVVSSDGTIGYCDTNNNFSLSAFSENQNIKSNEILNSKLSGGVLEITTRLNDNIESAYLSVKDISGLNERIINISPDLQNVSLNWANNKRGVFVISLFVNNKLCDSKRVIGL